MIRTRWAIELQGDQFDLKDAIYLFAANNPIQISKIEVVERKIVALLAAEFDACDEAIVVYERGQKLLSVVNGYLFAKDPDRKPLSLDGIYQRTEEGQWKPGAVIFTAGLAGGVSRARAYTGEPVTPVEVAWVSTSMNEVAIDVLHVLRGEPDWFDLWKAFERMRDDINKSFPRGTKTVVIGWPNTDHFSQSAQVYRHHKVKWGSYNPEKAMTLREAKSFVASLVLIWLRWRAGLQDDSSGE